jgi:hypothetical protein
MADSDIDTLNEFNEKIIAEFRAKEGRVGGPYGPRRLAAEAGRDGSFRRRIPGQDNATDSVVRADPREPTECLLKLSLTRPRVWTISRSWRFVAAGRSIAR